jgi:hypothetical protein
MSRRVISNPSIIVNNDTIEFIGGSLVYDAGEGEVKVRSVSTGGGGSNSIHAVDTEGRVGMVKFDVPLTNDLDGNIGTWKTRVGLNTIKFTEQLGTEFFNRSFTGLSLAPKVERNVGPDGVVSLDFQGDQMSPA